jgi:hypothetical protein
MQDSGCCFAAELWSAATCRRFLSRSLRAAKRIEEERRLVAAFYLGHCEQESESKKSGDLSLLSISVIACKKANRRRAATCRRTPN